MRNTYPLRAPNLAARTLAGEAIIMKPTDSSLYSLNETATQIWLAADGQRTLREIVESNICAGYDIDLEQALLDAEELALGLSEHAILLMLPEPAGAIA